MRTLRREVVETISNIEPFLSSAHCKPLRPNVRYGLPARCRLYPRKQTSPKTAALSVRCQHRTSGLIEPMYPGTPRRRFTSFSPVPELVGAHLRLISRLEILIKA